jgi:hypothetical protein
MAVRFPFRRGSATPAAVEAPPPPPPPRRGKSRLLAPPKAAWRGAQGVLGAIDQALCWFAVPFGTRIADPRRRYAVLLGAFALIYVLGALPVPVVPLVALAVGYVGVLAIGRAWVLNEKERTAIAKKLVDRDPDQMPDLRWTALVAALQLLILFPLLFQQVQQRWGLFKVEGQPNFWDWMWFSLDKTYLKALPDWSILYGVHISGIDFDKPWGRHLVLISRLTFDYILIQGALRIWAIRTTIAEAVAAIKADPDMAVRLGRRAIPALVQKLSDPDKAVRGAAANALVRLGDKEAIRRISEAAE